MTRTIAIALALTGAAPLLSAAKAPAQERYQIQLVISDGARAPVRPSLIAASGEAATFMIANERYSLRVSATARDGRVAISSDIGASSRHALHNDSPRLELAADGEPASLSFERVDPATGAASEVRIEVRARALDR